MTQTQRQTCQMYVHRNRNKSAVLGEQSELSKGAVFYPVQSVVSGSGSGPGLARESASFSSAEKSFRLLSTANVTDMISYSRRQNE